MIVISLTQGWVAHINADFSLYPNPKAEEILNHKWCVHRVGRRVPRLRMYAVRREKQKIILLHRVLMNAPDGMEVDHIDGNGLNNTRGNLRLVTGVQNSWGFRRKASGCSSRFRGVHWFKRCKKWSAHIEHRGRKIHLGYFDSETDAARAYDAAAKKYFGPYAQSNL